MQFLRKPWSMYEGADNFYFHPDDSLLAIEETKADLCQNFIILTEKNTNDTKIRLNLFPYPKGGHSKYPPIKKFPTRFRTGQKEPVTEEDKRSDQLTNQMNATIARVQELEKAFDDPTNVWNRLRTAWRLAEKENDPKMSEIVRQSKELLPVLKSLEKKIRRVLRRTRQFVPLDRVQEMDRRSMRWLSKQPGTSLEERAGSKQRILSVIREESFDTLENRVVRAYSVLAEQIARDWLRENERASHTYRYEAVKKFKVYCGSFSRRLIEKGIGEASAGIIPNYVLTQNKDYKLVFDAWHKLIRREKLLDDLWAWQAETWTDFSVLAIILSIDALDEAELIAQSPILWRAEARNGRWFEQENPIAVFWLKDTRRIIEIQSRPLKPGSAMGDSRAHVALRIYDIDNNEVPRRIVIWTPHNLQSFNLQNAAQQACQRINQMRYPLEIVGGGIILTPSHGEFQCSAYKLKNVSVEVVALDSFGKSLNYGLKKLSTILKSNYLGADHG